MKHCPFSLFVYSALVSSVALTLSLSFPEEPAGRTARGEAEAGWQVHRSGRTTRSRPPLTWSPAENIRWQIPLATWSNASPVLWKDRVYFMEEPATVVCADTKKAKILWRASVPFEEFLSPADGRAAEEAKRRLGELQKKSGLLSREVRALTLKVRGGGAGPDETRQLREKQTVLRTLAAEQRALQKQSRGMSKPPTHATNGYSSPTPVIADGKLYVLFGYGGAAAFDLDGKRLWARMVERSSHSWGHSASPLLTDGKLILHIGGSVHALDSDSGEELWQAPSPSTWGTPLPLRIGGERAVLTTGGVIVRCSDGTVVAAGVGAMPWTSPVERDGVIYIVDQSGAFAYALPERMEDKLNISKLWQSAPPRDRYYASPVVHGDILYAVTQRGVLSAIDTADGTVVYQQKLPLGGTFYPSIALAGGRIYVSSDTGQTVVLEPGREYRPLATNSLERFRSTPVFRDGNIYIRGLKHLYCIGAE